MRTLKRPMFNMGGPIKEGIMHKIREPYKNGTRAALVGNPIFPKDKSGRAHHVAWFAALPWLGQAAMRVGPAAYRGWKASRALTPWSQNLGKWGRFKDIFLPKKSLRLQTGAAEHAAKHKAGEGLGFGIGSFARKNPLSTLGIASTIPQAGYAGYKVATATPGALWKGAKRYADLVIPGDQEHWWKDPPLPTGVTNPNLDLLAQENMKKKKKDGKLDLTDAQRKAFATKQRDERVQKYLDMMGYDRSKKTAVADALIDASKIVSDRGTLDKKNITAELINPIIQATSKRFDKPDQIREAVGLMAAKAEIQKDLEKETKALDREYKQSQIDLAKQKKGESFEQEMLMYVGASKDGLSKKQMTQLAQGLANKYNENFKVVPEDTNIASLEDGIYMSEGKIFRVTDKVAKPLF